MLSIKTRGTNICGIDLWCEIKKSDIDDNDGMRYTTYGIDIKRERGVALSINDISTDREFVERFILLLESRNVSLTHVMDVLDDYMI